MCTHVTVTSGFQMQNILHFKLYLHFASWLNGNDPTKDVQASRMLVKLN